MEFENIKNVNKLDYEKWEINENYSGLDSSIGKSLGAKRLGFHVEILSPGKFSCPYHFHDSEEELFFVLEGNAMVRQQNYYRELGPGDIVFFHADKTGVHQFYNHTDSDFKFIAISNLDKNDVVEYPDSEKIFYRAEKKILKDGENVPYITGEENPAQFWEPQYLEQKKS